MSFSYYGILFQDSWHASMSHIFQYVGGNMPDDVFQDLKHEDPSILHVEKVNVL